MKWNFAKKTDRERAGFRQEQEKKLLALAGRPVEVLYRTLDSGSGGISSEMAAQRLEEHGPNVIVGEKQKGAFARLVEALVNPFNLVLLLVAAVTFVTDVLVAAKRDYTTVIILLALILLSSLIAFIQGQRSSAAAAKLFSMISNKATVIRAGEQLEIDMAEVVPGDVVRLSAGDMLPGDVRFLTAKDAFISQSALTGESAPVEKFGDRLPGEGDSLTDFPDLGFMGTNVVSGSATALVLETGNCTYLGSMSRSLSGDKAKNSFEKGVDSVSRLLLQFMFILVPTIFLINGCTKGDWTGSLLFAVTIAVGLTPEMLPMIMTSTLARGAMAMAKHQTIVKTLSAIQTFGEMDVLCTDKTGTLTEDKIVLERYMDVSGKDDDRVLRHAYLNSFFQTGLKNLIDIAVMARGEEKGLTDLQEKYTRVDEIPFDFSRRRMSVVLEAAGGKRQLITKGAVEELLPICAYVEQGGQVRPLTEESRAQVMAVYEKHNREGLRVLAVAQKNAIEGIGAFGVQDEKEMVLIGFIGFLDPPKESSKAAIQALKEHGIRTVVLTGDSEGVAVKVCKKVGVDVTHSLTGRDVERMDDTSLQKAVESCCLFSKLSPAQKERVVGALQKGGHTVGYMGDGINDSLAMRQADVGISVDSAVDIAKETADIILLKKDLMVLEQGVVEGRRTFGNIMKYLKMAISGNLGNMISILVASIFLPFLPLLPLHILVQNLLCDFSQMGIPFDTVDASYLRSPRRWDTASIKRFMLVMGPMSSFFDVSLYCILWFVLGANSLALAPLFQCGCFVFGTLSQIFSVHMIRTPKVPFLQSKASLQLTLSTAVVGLLALALGFTGLAAGLDLMALPLAFLPWLILLLLLYGVCIQAFKKIYEHRWNEWL